LIGQIVNVGGAQSRWRCVHGDRNDCEIVLEAIQQPIEVNVNQGPSFLGPLLIAAAALVAAVVAAYWHRAQLRHDRVLRDLEHARTSISAAVETVAGAVDAMSDFLVAARAADEAKRRAQSIEDSDNLGEAEMTEALAAETQAIQRVAGARQRASPFLTRMLADRMRLRIALGPDSEVITRHKELTEAFRKWFTDLAPEARASRKSNDDDAAGTEIRPALKRFEVACQQWSISTT
jgi:hypothetical protein